MWVRLVVREVGLVRNGGIDLGKREVVAIDDDDEG